MKHPGFFKFILTDERNHWDLGILQWFIGTVLFFGFSGYAYVYKGQVWDPTTWGIGLVSVLGSGAALQWFNRGKPTATPTTQEDKP